MLNLLAMMNKSQVTMAEFRPFIQAFIKDLDVPPEEIEVDDASSALRLDIYDYLFNNDQFPKMDEARVYSAVAYEEPRRVPAEMVSQPQSDGIMGDNAISNPITTYHIEGVLGKYEREHRTDVVIGSPKLPQQIPVPEISSPNIMEGPSIEGEETATIHSNYQYRLLIIMSISELV